MSWLNLNESLNSLKGQITNFATEVLSEGVSEQSGDKAANSEEKLKELEKKCREQELEIEELKKITEAQSQKRNGVKEDDPSSWYWDVPLQDKPPEGEAKMLDQIQALQEQISHLKKHSGQPDHQEFERLKEENRNLTTNLEDLDTQHQLAMERLLMLKVELQKNFELLKKEHEDLKTTNDEYLEEMKIFTAKINEKDEIIKSLSIVKMDFDSLLNKYQNLERVHGILRENAEKFQEENQELHEEVFKLQEQVTKLEHDLEVITKNGSSNAVSQDEYDKLLKEIKELGQRQNTSQVHTDEINIDDNAKSVIENLKREIGGLKHEMTQMKETTILNDITSEKITEMLDKYVPFDLPVDYVGEMPTAVENNTLFKLEHALRALNELNKDKEKLNSNILAKDVNITQLQAQVDDLTSENDFLTSDLQHYEMEIKEMKKNNDFLISEIAVLKNSSKLEPIIETHEDNIMSLENELANCSKKNKTFEHEVQKISKELEEVKVEKLFLQTSLKELKEKYSAMLNGLDLCQAQTKALEELETSVLDTNVTESDEINDLKKRLIVSTSRNEKMALTMQIIENDKVLLLKKLNDLTHELENKHPARNTEKDISKILLQNKIQDIETQYEELHKRKEKLASENAKLEERIKELEAHLANAKENEIKMKAENDNVIALLYSDNNDLKGAVDRMTKEFATIEKSQRELLKENDFLKENLNKNEALVTQNEMLRQENEKIKSENEDLLESKLDLDACQQSNDQKMETLNDGFDKIVKELSEKDIIIVSLKETLSKNKQTETDLSQTITDLQKSQGAKIKEIEDLKNIVTDLNERLKIASTTANQTSELNEMIKSKNALENKIGQLTVELDLRNTTISDLKSRLDEAMNASQEYKIALENKDREIIELNQTITALNNKNTSVQENDTVTEKLNDVQKLLENREKELIELKTKADYLEKASSDLLIAVEQATKEKAELVNLVTLKHNESVQYHQEIQRLNKILLEHADDTKKMIEEKQFNDTCQKCENLRMILREKDEIIKSVTGNGSELDRLETELSIAKQNITYLSGECDTYEKTIDNQVETIKYLTAQNVQLSEKENASRRELERLRSHLVETEDTYTQELMASERKLADAMATLNKVEERAKQNSTVYTSNSIRANQEVETYRNQIELLMKQREEAASKLSAVEDARARGETALANLQLVLEQFQSDKDRDIEAATVKLQNKMADQVAQNGRLQDEIQRLNKKLEESKAGLQAAARLGEQLENKTAIIQELKEQVQTLQSSVTAAEERYHNTVSNQQDKVDRRLVKNLVLNYVHTQGQSNLNRTQVLRILSSVLDFNQEECMKLGLTTGVNTTDSLAREFVSFLERESRPAVNLSTTVASEEERSVSRKNSSLGPQAIPLETGHKRNPSTGSNNLLFQNLDNVETSSQLSLETSSVHSETRATILDTGVNQTRNTEGAILKHVLKDM